MQRHFPAVIFVVKRLCLQLHSNRFSDSNRDFGWITFDTDAETKRREQGEERRFNKQNGPQTTGCGQQRTRPRSNSTIEWSLITKHKNTLKHKMLQRNQNNHTKLKVQQIVTVRPQGGAIYWTENKR
ncbi:hypothetical protein ILYODFUR_011840 [Ilyodon furcidens]|uniref:Uncharacterized protein n=1 Tax=Ilyodon furcidens TaxID=33524 RepID=A0ABV0U6G6_9TELE